MATRRQFLKGASYGLVLVGGQWVVTEAGAASSGIIAPPAAGGHYFTGDGRLPRAGEGHEPGESLVLVCGGGGGWGDPLDRDAGAVRDDVLDEYVSRQSAERDYGVVFQGKTEDLSLRVDEATTAALRARLRASRD